MILIDAIYINQGGGKVLLDLLINALIKKKIDVYFLLDERVKDEYLFLGKNVTFINSSLLKRFYFYFKNKKQFNSVFTFGNFPPPIKLKCTVYSYFQNLLLIESNFVSVKLFVKRVIFKYLFFNTHHWFVQSNVVKKKLSKLSKLSTQIHVFPFYKQINKNISIKKINNSSIKYIYVSSAENYKNHLNLLIAFEKYNNRYPKSSLTLTVSNKYLKIIKLIEQLKLRKINIINLGLKKNDEIIKKYLESDVMIFPSKKESFGLGLIEAAQLNMPVISSDLDYVYEVIQPSNVFDPYDSNSIYNCMCDHHNFIDKPAKINTSNKLNEMISFIVNNNKYV